MSLRILIVDDHRDYRTWLSHHLAVARPSAHIEDYNPVGNEPLPPDFLPSRWDLLFLDHTLGEHDGIDVLRRLKAGTDCPPIVFLAPQGDQHAIVRALEAGADDFLSKGRNTHEHISRVVREALRSSQALKVRPGGARKLDQPTFHLKGHRFLKALGKGATASVYLMERERSERLVVAKVFRQVPDRVHHVMPLERFLREYEVISGIRHPNVVQIFDLGIADDMAFIVMEYFPGGHLGERLSRGLPVPQALAYLRQIARALDAVHAVGVLHRDLKPANIMLRDDDTLALIDFGVAKLRDAAAELTGLGELFGTPYYMSPEQGEGAPVDERADIYSLGVVFYEMLTGRKPYVAGSPMAIIWKHRHAPLPTLPAPLESLQPLLDQMMAKSADKRFVSAAALLDALPR